MSDLLFQCPSCSKHMAIDDAGIGRTLACPDCRATVQAPAPGILFFCPACKMTLCAPAELVGETFGCSNCGHELTIPENTTVLCPLCATHIELDNATFEEVAGEEVNCPGCDAVVDIPAMPPA
jgi:DNA-directed RNA polymerase subunit M/transcription elongation factor TFIIS